MYASDGKGPGSRSVWWNARNNSARSTVENCGNKQIKLIFIYLVTPVVYCFRLIDRSFRCGLCSVITVHRITQSCVKVRDHLISVSRTFFFYTAVSYISNGLLILYIIFFFKRVAKREILFAFRRQYIKRTFPAVLLFFALPFSVLNNCCCVLPFLLIIPQ